MIFKDKINNRYYGIERGYFGQLRKIKIVMEWE